MTFFSCSSTQDELQAPPLDQEQSSLPRLAQELLEEKNLEIDQLEHQIQELQSSLDHQGTRSQQVRYQQKELVVEETIRVERRSAEAAPGSPDEDVKAEELVCGSLGCKIKQSLFVYCTQFSVYLAFPGNCIGTCSLNTLRGRE